MNKQKIYRSPLFYVGDKYKLLPEIKRYFPNKINRFIEPFTGGGSVFLNVRANEYLLNDIDTNVIKLHRFLSEQAKNPSDFFQKIQNRIDELGFSHSYKKDIVPQELKNKWKKTYYAKFNKQAFQELKKQYNNNKEKDPLDLYLLLIFGFNRMLRFNSKGEYNLPVGNVDFNKNVQNALLNYFYIVKNRNIRFFNLDFTNFIENTDFQQDDFVYFDPPYLITFSEYNKLWNENDEKILIGILDQLNQKGVKFAVSNITHYKGKINEVFLDWSQKYYSQNIKSNYISYHDNSIKTFNEVLITNYQPNFVEQPTIFDFEKIIEENITTKV
jgi:DNA adenine methylase